MYKPKIVFTPVIGVEVVADTPSFDKAILSQNGVTKENYWQAKQQFYNGLQTGKVNEHQAFANLFDILDLRGFNFDAMRKTFYSDYELRDGVDGFHDYLREQRIALGAATNTWPERVAYIGEKFGFGKDFDVEVYSYEIRKKKNDPEFIGLIIEKTGLRISGIKGEEIVLFDDDQQVLSNARQFGIRAEDEDEKLPGRELFESLIRKIENPPKIQTQF